MRIVATSDTHGYEPAFSEWGEVIVIAGDLTAFGKEADVAKFSKWITTLAKKFKHIVFIAGNHDWLFQSDTRAINSFKKLWAEAGNIHYLEDSGVTIDGVKFWGSPWTPMFYNWAFMKEDHELAEVWAKIPTDTDVLITHGPPRGILDKTARGPQAGSETLRQAVLGRVLPQVHVTGHIHEAYGKTESLGEPTVRFYNVAYVDLDYEPVNLPVHFEVFIRA
jgi:Icc-related predicted phosphoesterase